MTPTAALPDPLLIEPARRPFDITITPPGSKSMTCRAYLLAALAAGTSRVARPLRSDDTDRLLSALEALGAEARWEGFDVRIRGVAGRFPRGGAVDLGDGGTPARFMLAAARLATEPVVVDGSARMRERPVADLVALLRRLGADLEHVGAPGQLPVRVAPAPLRGGVLDVPTTASSQFISALLLVAPHLAGGLELRFTGSVTSASYVELTLGMLRRCGIDVQTRRNDAGGLERARVAAAPVPALDLAIEPDASSAVYWWIAGLLVPGARLRVPGIGPDSAQPDVRVLELLGQRGRDAGAVHADADGITTVGGAARYPIGGGESVCAAEAPDGAMAMAVFAATVNRAAGDGSDAGARAGALTSRLHGLGTLRVKETDRLAALAAELGRIGCAVTCTDDAITIDPAGPRTDPVVIETYNDHRMAMAFGILGLVRPNLAIADPGCVRKSYPGFWDDLRRLTEVRGT